MALAEVKDGYDNILIDTPPSDSLITVNAFIASDDVILPVQAEQEAVNGLDSIIESIGQIKRGLNPDLQIAGILPVMVKRVSSNSIDMVRRINEKYPGLVVEDWIPETALLGESTRLRRPLIFTEPQSDSVSRREVLERAASTDEFVEHAVECAESDRKMPFSFFQMRRSVRKLGGKPPAVGERHHEISASLPEHGRD